MIRDIDNYFLQQQEPTKGCLIALRHLISTYDSEFTEAWKYRMPFFLYKGRMFCYLWTDKKTKLPYIGIVEGKNISHPRLVMANRARMKILPIDPGKDIPVKTIHEILKKAMTLYKS
ncbi:MAG TPA: DUF1801 domain-containing protein [Chryseolinea sp.]|nr:DUF1801 domain-containing protein [Chryseolinea sp.]